IPDHTHDLISEDHLPDVYKMSSCFQIRVEDDVLVIKGGRTPLEISLQNIQNFSRFREQNKKISRLNFP
ncbi:MAG TPA: hypothetical protein VFN95_11700, partial [Flavitalea sp.]|nr:hypothetical protein [Flavitalea sp.]